MAYPQTQKKSTSILGDSSNPLLMLIVFNVLVFIILNFISIVYVLSNSAPGTFEAQIMQWFELPASLETLVTRPWVILSHMFSQISVWALIGNLFFLWAFGYLLQDLIGNRHVVPLYIYGALAGAVLFIASANIFPRFYAVVETFSFTGAGAAVMAIAVAATTLAPDYRVFPMINGGIPLWVITLIYVIIDFAGLASVAFPHHLAHLGGAVIGYVYIQQVRGGKDPGNWMHRLYHWFNHLFDPSKRKLKPVVKEQVFYNTKGKKPFTKTPTVNERKIDEILDKISEHGVEALTPEEKEILKKASENDTL